MASPVSTPEPAPGSGAGQRRTILDAALTVLDRDGEARFTVRSVAAEAGCSTTGVYTWFGGKGGLVDAIFVEGFESFDAALAPAYAADDIVAAGAAYRTWALGNCTHYLVMFGRAVPDHVPGDDAMLRGDASFVNLQGLLERLGAPDAFEWAFHVNATAHGYVMSELTGMAPAPQEDLDRLYDLGVRRAIAPLLGG